MATEKRLTVRTFDELFREEKLPSGARFKLVEDTVDNSLKVAEQDHHLTYMKKAMQIFCVLDSIGGIKLHEEGSPGVEVINGLLDTDVVFLGLAWTAQMADMTLELNDGVPCPHCGHHWMEVPFGNLKVMCRDEPVSGADAQVALKAEKGWAPASMGLSWMITDPTWEKARRFIPEKQWGSTDHITMHRAMAATMVESSSGGSVRQPSMKGELRKLRMRGISAINRALDANVPRMQMHLDLECSNCGQVTQLPFEQGV